MQAQAYEGYFEDGRFYTAGQVIRIPERQRVYITVLDEPIADEDHAGAWSEFLARIKEIDDEPLTDFEKVKFREIDI